MRHAGPRPWAGVCGGIAAGGPVQRVGGSRARRLIRRQWCGSEGRQRYNYRRKEGGDGEEQAVRTSLREMGVGKRRWRAGEWKGEGARDAKWCGGAQTVSGGQRCSCDIPEERRRGGGPGRSMLWSEGGEVKAADDGWTGTCGVCESVGVYVYVWVRERGRGRRE